MDQPGARVLKYSRQDGQITGCVYLQKKAESLYLGMLSVSPDCQAQGIGSQLLQAADMQAVQEGCQQIYMTVISIRHELISWYQRHGYELTGEIKPFEEDHRYGVPTQALEFLVLAKKMSPAAL